MSFKDIILITLTFLIMGCDGSYQSNKDEMITELKTYDNPCPSSGCVFVAVGDSGTVLTSPDGITWTSRNSGTGNTKYAKGRRFFDYYKNYGQNSKIDQNQDLREEL